MLKKSHGGSFQCLGDVLGRLGSVFGVFEGVLGASGGVLGASWGVLGTSWGRLGNVLERRSVPFLIRKRPQNQTNIIWPKNVGLKNAGVSQTSIRNLWFFNDFGWLSIREVWERGRRQRELPVGRGISTSLIGGRVLYKQQANTTTPTNTTRLLPSPRGLGGRI